MATFRDVILRLSVDTGNSEQEVKDLTKQIDKLEKEIEQAERGTIEYEKAQRKLALLNRQMAQSTKQYAQEVRSTRTAQRNATQSTNQLSTGFNSLQTAVKGFVALEVVQKLIGLGKQALTAAANLERNTIAFETFLGSAEKAQIVLADLTEFANITPFRNDEVITAGRNLIAFGESATNVTKTLNTLGNISSAVNIPLNELASIFGKTRQQGRLFADDLNQLTGRGIPVIQEFAKQFGVSESEVRKLVETGKIGFSQLEKAFQDLTGEGGKFFGLIEKQSTSLSGLVSTLDGKFTSFLAKLANESGLVQGTTKTLGTLIKLVDILSSSLSKADGSADKFAIAFKIAFAPLLPIIQGAGDAMNLLDDFVEEAGASADESAKSFNKFKSAISGLSDTELQKSLEAQKKGIEDLNKAIESNIELNGLGQLTVIDGFEKDQEINKQLLAASKQRIAAIELELDARATAEKQATNIKEAENKKNRKLNLEFQALILQDEIRTQSRIVENQDKATAERLDSIDSLIEKNKQLSAIRLKLANFDEKEDLKKRNNAKKEEIALNEEFIRINKQRIDIIQGLESANDQLRKKSLENAGKALKEGVALIEEQAQGIDRVNKFASALGDETATTLEKLTPLIQQFAGIAVDSVNAIFQAQEDRINSQIDLQKDRITQAEALAEKGNVTALRLERERLAALEQRREAAAQRDARLTAIQTAAQIGLAIARTAAESGIFSVASIPVLLGAIGAGISVIPSLISGFEEGGFTGKGKSDEVAGVVHKGEYVAPSTQLRNPKTKPYIQALEAHRKTGIFNPPTSQPMQAQVIRLDKLEQSQEQTNRLLEGLLGQRASMSVTENGIKYAYDSANSRISKIKGKV